MIDTVLYVEGIHYWAWFATFYLIILTVQDYRNKRLVNQRFNYVMLGITISLISHLPVTLLYLLTLIATVVILRIYLQKFKLIGEADITALNWIFLGFGYINYIFLLGYVLVFIFTTLLYTLLKLYLFKYKKPTPFFTIILVSFWFAAYVFGLY